MCGHVRKINISSVQLITNSCQPSHGVIVSNSQCVESLRVVSIVSRVNGKQLQRDYYCWSKIWILWMGCALVRENRSVMWYFCRRIVIVMQWSATSMIAALNFREEAEVCPVIEKRETQVWDGFTELDGWIGDICRKAETNAVKKALVITENEEERIQE